MRYDLYEVNGHMYTLEQLRLSHKYIYKNVVEELDNIFFSQKNKKNMKLEK